jgi:hypothetical protein
VANNPFGSVTSSVAQLVLALPLEEALDMPGLLWTNGTDAAWYGQTTVSHDGMDAAQSGPITHNEQSTMQTTVNGPGVLTFWWKVSSESCCDRLRFYVSGVEQTNIAGEINWQQRTLPIPSGSQTLEWVYSKDSSVSSGQDRAWVDEVTFTPFQLVGVERHPRCNFGFALPVVPGKSYRIEASSDLENWTSISNFVPTNLLIRIEVIENENYPHRFFRVATP